MKPQSETFYISSFTKTHKEKYLSQNYLCLKSVEKLQFMTLKSQKMLKKTL